MWELDHKEDWMLKNWCFLIVEPEKILESPLDRKEAKPVNPKGNQLLLFIGRTDAEAKVPIIWPFDVKSWLLGEDPDIGKDWGQKENGIPEDEIVGWHRWLNGYEFGQTVGENGQESLASVHSVAKICMQLSDWTTKLSITTFRCLLSNLNM